MPVLVRNEERDIGTSDVPDLKTLQSSEQHTYVTKYYLSEQWGINLAQATITLKKTTHNFLYSAVLTFSRRYCTYIVFKRNKLEGQWSCDTMNVR